MTVSLEDPVAAALARTIPLATKPPPENALVWLLHMPPAVTAVRPEPPRPLCPVRHRRNVSEPHTVTSQAVLPDADDRESPASPRFDP